jgi:hypothetical protein
VLDPTILVLRNLVLSLFQIVQAMYYLEEIVWTICLLIVVDYARFFSLRIASVTPQQPAQLRTRAVWWLCALVHRLLTLYLVMSSTLFFDNLFFYSRRRTTLLSLKSTAREQIAQRS